MNGPLLAKRSCTDVIQLAQGRTGLESSPNPLSAILKSKRNRRRNLRRKAKESTVETESECYSLEPSTSKDSWPPGGVRGFSTQNLQRSHSPAIKYCEVLRHLIRRMPHRRCIQVKGTLLLGGHLGSLLSDLGGLFAIRF